MAVLIVVCESLTNDSMRVDVAVCKVLTIFTTLTCVNVVKIVNPFSSIRLIFLKWKEAEAKASESLENLRRHVSSWRIQNNDVDDQ